MRVMIVAPLLGMSIVGRSTVDAQQPVNSAWKLRVIDSSSRGADGVRLQDVDKDGLLDITTAWEEGGRVRVYRNPGPRGARNPWPATTVGKVGAPEDAAFVDLDADGAVDVVSSCEGNERKVFVHWAPRRSSESGNADAWKMEPLPASVNLMQWMFTTPLQVDGRNGVDLVSGGKNQGAKIGWFEAPANARDLPKWVWHPIYDAGWITSALARNYHTLPGKSDPPPLTRGGVLAAGQAPVCLGADHVCPLAS